MTRHLYERYHTCLCEGAGWRRLIGFPQLQIIFHERATKYRSLLRKMTYKDNGSYESSPPCTRDLYVRHDAFSFVWHDSFSQVCHDSFSYVRHDSIFVCETLHLHMWDMTHSHLCDMTHSHKCAMTHSHMCDMTMTHSHMCDMTRYLYMRHFIFTCEIWRSRMRDLTQMWMRHVSHIICDFYARHDAFSFAISQKCERVVYLLVCMYKVISYMCLPHNKNRRHT